MIRQVNTLLIILIGFLVAYWLRFGTTSLTEGYLIALVISLFLLSVIFPATGAFRDEFEWEVLRRMRRLVAGWAIVLLMLVSIAAVTKTSGLLFPYLVRTLGHLSQLCGLGAVLFSSYFISVGARNRGRKASPIALVGSGEAAVRLENRIQNDPASDMFVSQRFGQAWSEEPTRPISELNNYIDSNNINSVWVAVPWEDKNTLREILHVLSESVADVNVVPDFYQYRLLNQNVSVWAGLPIISLSSTPMTDAEALLKALMDRVGAFFLILLLSPLLLFVFLLILFVDGWPVLFNQSRHGISGEPIKIVKFRTMKKGAEKQQFNQALREDGRVTTIGKFLRKTSLDELPQFLNVLKGEMSLVGPRPHPIELNEEFKSRIPRYMLRHKVKPGITGWAQVNGHRGGTETEEKMSLRIEHDLWYIQNWSLWLDLKILLMTPLVLIHRNAY